MRFTFLIPWRIRQSVFLCRTLNPVLLRDLVFQVEAVTITCCLIFDNISTFVENRVAIGSLHSFVNIVKSSAFAAMLPVLSRRLNDKVEQSNKLVVCSLTTCTSLWTIQTYFPVIQDWEPVLKAACEYTSKLHCRSL